MSVREEPEREKKNCPNRALRLAAAAIGVGIGAALYYFVNKREEHPNNEGATSSRWTCENNQSLEKPSRNNMSDLEEEYTTISEHSTTDTSINESQTQGTLADSSGSYLESAFSCTSTSRNISNESSQSSSEDDESCEWATSDCSSTQDILSVSSEGSQESALRDASECMDISIQSESSQSSNEDNERFEWVTSDYLSDEFADDEGSTTIPVTDVIMISSDSEIDDTEYDAIRNCLDIVRLSTFSLQSGIISILSHNNPRNRSPLYQEEQQNAIREQHFRERSWSLEECSVCCEVMLRDQDLKRLPCAHNFHSQCITPWLEEHQTCPNCRKTT